MTGRTSAPVAPGLPARPGFDSPVARSPHDSDTCPVCAPVLASAAYHHGVQRAINDRGEP